MSRDAVPARRVSFNASPFMLFNACVALCVLGELLAIWHPPAPHRTDRGAAASPLVSSPAREQQQ